MSGQLWETETKLLLHVCLSYFSGSIVRKMVLDRQHLGVTKSRCIVWGVAFLSDGTVISVDSVGKVQLWDSTTGTLVKSHVIANADVQSIAVADVSMLPAQVVLLSLLRSQEYDLISPSPAIKSA